MHVDKRKPSFEALRNYLQLSFTLQRSAIERDATFPTISTNKSFGRASMILMGGMFLCIFLNLLISFFALNKAMRIKFVLIRK
jgi:hypothetical protein